MENHKKTLGVIGGLGPMATAYFMELVISMTKAERDQDHLQMIVYNNPGIPDRTAFILNKSPANPVPEMVRIGHALAEQNVDCVAIPCITAHYFWEELEREIPVPVLNAIADTAKHLQEHGIQTTAIMATDGTIATGLLQRTLEQAGMRVILPDAVDQEGIMNLIYRDIKAGNEPDMELFHRIREHLFAEGAEAIILGCTELSLIKKEFSIGPGFIDAMEVLAQQAVLQCGGELKEKYRCLITG